MSTTKKAPGIGTIASQKKITTFADQEDDEEDDLRPRAEIEGRDVDPDALAFITAKRKVDDLQRAKKAEKRIH